MHILVAGGAGFIGSHLCAALIARGDSVVAIDHLGTGAHKNVAQLPNGAFEFIEHDIVEPLPDATSLKNLDAIVNLACPASPVHYQRDPVATMRTCFEGTLRLLQLARGANIRLLHASTSEIYGDPLVHPQGEDYLGNVNCTGPRACYDEGKRAAETLCADFKRAGLDVRVARIFNTYGPRMAKDDGRVVSNFIVQALANAPLTMYGSGEQTRSFCYVDDLVAAFLALLAHRGPCSPINLGNPHERTVADLARRIIRLCESHSSLESRPLPTDDPRRRRPDIARAQALLGWQPLTDIDVGLSRTIAYFRSL